MSTISKPSRKYLLRKGHWYQADTYLIQYGGEPAVAKDYRDRPLIIRWIARLFLINKELRTYRRLAGIEGIPRLYGTLGRYGFVLEYKRGKTLSKFRPHQLPASFFNQLEEIINQMHNRGIAHCDIRRKNVLVTNEGRPCLLDFNTSFDRGSWYNLIKRLFFPLLCQLDRHDFLKIKASLAPQDLSQQEEDFLRKEFLWYKLGRLVRKGIYRRIKRQWKKKKLLCPAALPAWNKLYPVDTRAVLANMVRGLMIKGYTREKIIEIGIEFNLRHGSPIGDREWLVDYLEGCYHRVLEEFKRSNCIVNFCDYLRKRRFCKVKTRQCKWRSSWMEIYQPIKDDF